MIDTIKLTNYYNAKHGAKANPDSNRIKKAVARCDALELTTEDIITYEADHPFSDLCDGLTQFGPEILNWKTEKAVTEKQEVSERVQKEANLDSSVGLLESTLAFIISQNAPVNAPVTAPVNSPAFMDLPFTAAAKAPVAPPTIPPISAPKKNCPSGS